MRNLLFIIIPFLMFFSCKEETVEEELEPIDKDSLYGKWQLVEEWDAISGYYDVEDGYFITLNSDSSFLTTQRGVGCPDGRKEGFFELSSNSISDMLYIELDCVIEGYDDFVPHFLYRYEMTDGFLKL
ncbi:hypothetical protein [uncultured Marivirga sp.]|uniref:hypothetical protein n=1 Tax=uncultured Marivirga sp. TaxID=1123707 RepID=UPI0030EE1A23